jgi:hypothetical protein
MKNIHLLFMATIISFALNSCSLKVASGQDGKDGLAKEDCYPDRKTVESKSLFEAKIMLIGEEMYLVPVDDDTQRYSPCNLPAGYKENDKVKVALDIKEIQPHERWAGTPCVITNIVESK